MTIKFIALIVIDCLTRKIIIIINESIQFCFILTIKWSKIIEIMMSCNYWNKSSKTCLSIVSDSFVLHL